MSRGFESHALRCTSPPRHRPKRGCTRERARDRVQPRAAAPSDRPARSAASARAPGRRCSALVGGALAVVLVAGGVGRRDRGLRQLDRSHRAPSTIEADDSRARRRRSAPIEGGFNILLVGSDTREGQGGIGGTTEEAAVLNDVNMLLHISQDQTNAVARQLPARHGRAAPRVPTNGGPAAMRPADQHDALLRRPRLHGRRPCRTSPASTIQFAGMISSTGVIAMSNAVGGVDVCVAEPDRRRVHRPQPPDGRHAHARGLRRARVPPHAPRRRRRQRPRPASARSRSSCRRWCARCKSDDTLTDFGEALRHRAARRRRT